MAAIEDEHVMDVDLGDEIDENDAWLVFIMTTDNR